eukprot:TRINITY_DN9693_c0_g1_i1.p1 TRINITY_DN9693_c0_g1~~TRINITY_DN9693_c0_g1_i1.p1  ORF type:complete len:280 (+),score=29.93 TRINITY_DN9693_c0_g1_i1:77-916(+)
MAQTTNTLYPTVAPTYIATNPTTQPGYASPVYANPTAPVYAQPSSGFDHQNSATTKLSSSSDSESTSDLKDRLVHRGSGMVFDFGGILSESWEIFKKHPCFYVSFTLLAVITACFALIPITLLFIISMLDVSLNILRIGDHELTRSNIIRWRIVCPVFGQILIMSVLIFIGYFCLIIPGIYLSIAFMFATPMLLEYYELEDGQQGVTIMESLKITEQVSRNMNNFIQLFILSVIIQLVASAGFLLFIIGMLVTIPLAIIMQAVAFRDIFGLRGAYQVQV